MWKQGQNQITHTEKYDKTVEDNSTEQNRALYSRYVPQETTRVSDYEAEAIVLVLNYQLFSTFTANNRRSHFIGEAKSSVTRNRYQQSNSSTEPSTVPTLKTGSLALRAIRASFNLRHTKRYPYTPITATNSFTAAALLSSAAFSSGVSLISIICSNPFAPSLQGTPTYKPEIPYSP